MSKLGILRDWYDTVWIKGDLSAIDRFIAPEVQANGIIQNMQVDISDFQAMVSAMRTLIEDIRVEFPRSFEKDDWLAALLEVHATRQDTGAEVSVSGQVLVRFERDKMIETYNHLDYVSFFEQMGQFPPNTLPLCLTGQRLDIA